MIVLIPCFYWLKVRMGNARVLLGHLAYNHVLLLWYFAYVDYRTVSGFILLDLGWFLVHWMAMICLYEIGYAQNDLYAAQREENPRLRGAPLEVRQRFGLFVGVRVATAFSVLLASWAFFSKMATVIIGGIDLIVLAVFLVHNALEKARRFQTFLLLRFLRYYAFAFIKPEMGVIHLQLFVFSLVHGLIESLHYLEVGERIRRRYFLIANCISLIAFGFADSMPNFFAYPVGLAILATAKSALPARGQRRQGPEVEGAASLAGHERG